MADSKNAWMLEERWPCETQYARETEFEVAVQQKNLMRRSKEGGERWQEDGGSDEMHAG
jgi:hypothetical protein